MANQNDPTAVVVQANDDDTLRLPFLHLTNATTIIYACM